MSVRVEIADAASTVDGITAHPYFKQGSHPGHTFVRIDRIEYPNPFGGVCFWSVIVVLPSDMEQAEKFIETKVPLIRAAIDPHLAITEVVPQRLNIMGTSDLLCVFINGHREE